MNNFFTEEAYENMIGELFCRFPSFQKVGTGAYKPGIANMEFADQLMGHPHKNYKIIHVAGTNGKGSVSSMLASALAASGRKVGLYTSPHILDFRERARVVAEGSFTLISKEYVWNFIHQWKDTFDHLDMSFFEITTLLALSWFADQEVDVVVLETGLGGRLDSTNIVTPVLSIITNIGLDHCDLLGETLPEVAFEKAGIIKPKVPVVVGESHPETDAVFERKVLYTNLPEPMFMGNRNVIMSLLTFADKVEPALWSEHEAMLSGMDLQGDYQRKNLRTVLAALEVVSAGNLIGGIGILPSPDRGLQSGRGPMETTGFQLYESILHAAERTGFRGRWEKLSDDPWIICDIGHNEHGLKYNFAQLEKMKSEGKCTDLVIVYGSVADKDVDAVMGLMPREAVYVFTQANGKRALPAEKVYDKYAASGRSMENVHTAGNVKEALSLAMRIVSGLGSVSPDARPLVYIGGSTYVVSEAVALL